MTPAETFVVVALVIAAFISLLCAIEWAGERGWFDRLAGWLDYDHPGRQFYLESDRDVTPVNGGVPPELAKLNDSDDEARALSLRPVVDAPTDDETARILAAVRREDDQLRGLPKGSGDA